MRQVIQTTSGEQEIDPYGRKSDHERWLTRIGYYSNNIDYYTFVNLQPEISKLVTQYILDMTHGKNIAKGSPRGARSYNHLYNIKNRTENVILMIENFCKKPILQIDEDDAIRFFQGMRNGVVKNKTGGTYQHVATYAKVFSAFWRWMVRTQGIKSVVEHVDTRNDEKPKWEHFTLKDVEVMADFTNSLYYKALLFFLFDSGIRAPKELMNVRVKDLTPVLDTQYYFLQIRDETSKTFGRKIKLMICSEVLRKYLQHSGLQPQDFLFFKTYQVMSRMVSALGYKALKRGDVCKQANGKVLIRNGVTMYDFRHNSVCHYLPIYRSENQMKYRYGWAKADMIQYYSEYIGMRDTISDEDMVLDSSKPQLILELEREKQKVALMEERMRAKEQEMEERMKKMEALMLQKFSDNF